MCLLRLVVGPDAITGSPGSKVPVIAVAAEHLPTPLTQPPTVQSAITALTREAGHVPRASSRFDPLSLVHLTMSKHLILNQVPVECCTCLRHLGHKFEKDVLMFVAGLHEL